VVAWAAGRRSAGVSAVGPAAEAAEAAGAHQSRVPAAPPWI
jgi:hypothetical protein